MALKLYFCIGYDPDVRSTEGPLMECYFRAPDVDTARQMWAELFDLIGSDMDKDEIKEFVEEMNFSAITLKAYPENAAVEAGAVDWDEIISAIAAGV